MKPIIKICTPHFNAWKHAEDNSIIPNDPPLPIEQAMNDIVGDICRGGVMYEADSFCFMWERCHSTWVDYGRNTLVKGNSSNDVADCVPDDRFTHFLTTDPDMSFTYDNIKRLLSHDKDIVSGAYIERQNYKRGKMVYCAGHFTDGMYIKNYLSTANKGLKEVDWTGMGFRLDKRLVYKKVKYPWFDPCYKKIKNTWQPIKDDIAFCTKAHGKVKIYVDCDCVVNHHIGG